MISTTNGIKQIFALVLQWLQVTYPINSSSYDLKINQWSSHYELSKASYTKKLN
jgi:hypothetical protein